MVNNVPPSKSTGGIPGRDDETLKLLFPYSPLYHTDPPPPGAVEQGVGGGDSFDFDSKMFYQKMVLSGQRSTGFGIDGFYADYYKNDPPDMFEVGELKGSTTDGGNLAKSVSSGRSANDPKLRWPVPRPDLLNPDNTKKVTKVVFRNTDAGYGSGPGGVSTEGNPLDASFNLSKGTPLSPPPEGVSSATSPLKVSGD